MTQNILGHSDGVGNVLLAIFIIYPMESFPSNELMKLVESTQ